ncbi:LuxR family two component transcriptional regulator [Salana multivorans]|uniref:LuxR family two component transcriptional regulator n=1 Tax=Salana multivorans TaxID=120377 RepID=A0A3N2DBF7_9MICO|nr:response regulator transcription factor [Salana multivorans]ROR97135.1 LuxR family two component transcriptional regulator [Salana multivorans]
MGRAASCRVAIVEDHRLQRLRTEDLLLRGGDFTIVFSGESLPEFMTWVRSTPPGHRPHLLVLDLVVERQPNVDVNLVAALLRAGLRIVVLTAMSSPPLVRRIVRAGVTVVVGKRDPEEDVLAGVHAALRGEEWMTSELAAVLAGDPDRPRLSQQEERALVLYATGLTVEQVATSMGIGRDTAKQYLDRVKKKYAAAGVPVRSKLDFGRIAWSEGLIDPESGSASSVWTDAAGAGDAREPAE